MDQPSTGLLRLNLETRACHRDADACWLDLLTPTVTRTDYVQQLISTYGFEAPLEAALAYTPSLKQFVDLRQRSRAGLIARDLLSLGLTAHEIAKLPQCLIAPFSEPIEALGWLYVMERATLLHDRARTHLQTWLPEVDDVFAYFSAYDGVVNARWSELGHAIDLALRTKPHADALVPAARAAFRCLFAWNRVGANAERRLGA